MMNTLRVLALLLVAAPLAGAAQQLKPNEIPTNLPGVTTVLAPPEGFDPIAASDEDLAYYGFPPRPDRTLDEEQFQHWAKAMKASKKRIIPTLKEGPRAFGPARLHQNLKSKADDTTQWTADTWSGYIHVDDVKKYGKSSMWYVMSDFIVPVANQAFNECTGNTDIAGSWVGIDGYDSVGLLQSGIEYDAYCNGGATSTNYAVWYEWFPNNQVYVTNFPISPGDDFLVEVWNSSATQGYAYIVNYTAGFATEVSFSAPAGYGIIGDSADWIIEAPGGRTLTNYIAEPFFYASAATFSGKKVDPGDSIQIIQVDAQGNPISFPTLLGTKAFLMQDEGSAYQPQQ
jgi:hypothetical protein